MSTLTYARTDLFIGGAWQPSSGREVTPIICPATEAPVGEAPTGTFTDADRAIDAARQALRASPWAGPTGQ
jgi:aldehyde dehydrogenase (NAD+)